jgi:hypothetical protein
MHEECGDLCMQDFGVAWRAGCTDFTVATNYRKEWVWLRIKKMMGLRLNFETK